MKNLLIIIALMISLSGFGQEHVEVSIAIQWPEQDTVVLLTLTTANDYLDYCYADSSIKYQYMKVTWDGMGWDTTYTLSMYPIMMESSTHKIPPIYQHRTPTFEGYVKWLEKLIQ